MKKYFYLIAFALAFLLPNPCCADFYQIGGSGGGGSGTVTSVGLTGDGTVFNATVTGSPVTTTGTFAPTLHTQAAATLFGNFTGSTAAPTFTSAGTTDQVLGVAHTGGGLEGKTITAGSGITITPTAGVITIAASGSGTVTSFSAGTLSPLFTTSVATSTTTPALTFALSTCGAGTVLGNFTSSTAAPTYGQLLGTMVDATALALDRNGLANAAFTNDICIGDAATTAAAGGGHNIIIGHSASTATSAGDALVIGHSASIAANGQDAVAIGHAAQANQNSNVALGVSAQASGNNSAVAIGPSASSSSNSSVAVGSTANASSTFAAAFGYNSAASASHALALGESTVADAADSVALGSLSTTDSLPNVVSVGHSTTVARDIIHIQHLLGGGVKPSNTPGTGAGGSPTVTNLGTDLDGSVSVTTGTAPVLSAAIVTINFATAFASAPFVVITPANANAALLSGVTGVYVTSTVNGFTINSGTTALTTATQYVFNYIVMQ